MIKVLYISNGVGIGGAENSLLDMIESLEDEVIPIVVVPQIGYLTNILLKRKIKFYVVPFESGYGCRNSNTIENRERNFIDNFCAAKDVVKICYLESIDLIHTNSFTSNVGAIAAVLAGIPHIWHLRELLEEHYNSEVWDYNLKVDLLKSSGIVISISDFVGNNYKNKYGCKVTTVYNAIDEKRYFKPITNKKKNKKFVLAAAYISKAKGQRDAVLAMEYLSQRGYKNYELYIIGNSSDIEGWSLNNYARTNKLDNIHFIDTVEDLSQYREACGFAIITSKFEGLGRVTIESMYAGNIVIGANSGGTKEILEKDGKYGYLYEPGDYKDLARVMLKASENDNDELRKIAQEYALDKFSKKSFAKKIYDLYCCSLNGTKIDNINLKNKLKLRFKEIEDSGLDIVKTFDGQRENRKSEIINDLILKLDELKRQGYTMEKIIGVKNISLYGFGIIGRRIYEELIGTEISIKSIYDRKIEDCLGFEIHKTDKIVNDGSTIIISVVGESELKLYCEERGTKAILFEDLVYAFYT